jgi:hypothetical protein
MSEGTQGTDRQKCGGQKQVLSPLLP